jgi:8-oxoguanine deaminase
MTDAAAGGLLIEGAGAVWTGFRGVGLERLDTAQGLNIRVQGSRIAQIGHLHAQPGETVIHARGGVVMPGWVNTHHHLFQSLLKGVPAGIDLPLTAWLEAVPLPYRRGFDHADVLRTAVRLGLVELMLSGCTTVADHQYHYYPDMAWDATQVLFEEAAALGVRMVLCRGGMTRARSFGGDAPPQARPETLDAFIRSVDDAADRYHQAAPDAMRRVVSAITTPTYSCSPDELRQLAAHARSRGLMLHSHLSENHGYVAFCQEVHGFTPLDFVAQHGWTGPDVWFAHMVHLTPAEIALCVRTGTGVAHCPQSNARLGSGIAPVPAYLQSGVRLGLAVDGAASNEACDMLSEAHAAWLLHRARPGVRPDDATGLSGQADAITVGDVIHIGTQGGAQLMGLPGLGTLAVGQAADIAIWSPDDIAYQGLHDPAIGPVASGRGQLISLLCAGREVVRQGEVVGIDMPALRALAQHHTQQLMRIA